MRLEPAGDSGVSCTAIIRLPAKAQPDYLAVIGEPVNPGGGDVVTERFLSAGRRPLVSPETHGKKQAGGSGFGFEPDEAQLHQ